MALTLAVKHAYVAAFYVIQDVLEADTRQLNIKPSPYGHGFGSFFAKSALQ